MAVTVLMLLCLAVGALRHTPVYDAFLSGAREGLETAVRILPALIAMLCAIRVFMASGLMDGLTGLLSPIFVRLGVPRETLPLMLMRPLSGSAALALLRETLETYGPDSRVGLMASVMMGSSETVFYTCGLYLGAASVKKSRHIIPCALLAWLAGSIAAALLYPAP